MVIATIALLPVMTGPRPVATVEAAGIVAMVTVVSMVSVWGILWGTRLVSPGRAGLLLMMEVITGLASAALLAGEPFGTVQVIGSMLIVAAAVVEVVPVGRWYGM